jgi:hypothetical protein
MSELSFAEFSEAFSPPTLVPTLNALLVALSLPFELASPTDMTPSLLLAVLESILESRLPIPASIRASRSSLAKVEAMKVFLGVLECDVLPQDEDIGLADLDPRRLAEGGWEETVFVGELLCWLGRKRSIIDALVGDDSESEVDFTASMLLRSEPSRVELSHITDVPRHPRVASPSTRSTATMSAQTDLSMHNTSQAESDTSIADSELSDHTETQPIHNTGVYRQPQCIHELEDPSYFLHPGALCASNVDDSIEEFDPNLSTQSSSSAEQPPTPTPQPVRLKGWIGAVDSALEISAFAANKLNTSTPVKNRSRRQSTTAGLYPTMSGSSTPRMQTTSLRTPASAPSVRMRAGNSRLPPPPTSAHLRKAEYCSPTERTVELLNERARLLGELADLRKAKTVSRWQEK